MVMQASLFGFVEPDRPFRYSLPTGFSVSVRLEQRGNGRYWYIRKYANGRSYQEYVAKAGELTETAVMDAAAKVEQAINGGEK